jgi:hypothetical protein
MEKFTLTIWYALLAAALIAIVVTVTTGLVILIPLVLVLLGLAYGASSAVNWTRQRAAQFADQHDIPFVGDPPAEQRVVVLPDGNEHIGRVVPLKQMDGHRMVLTARGYVLTDDDGYVRHVFRPDADADE